MGKNSLVWSIGGEAGDGILSAGEAFARACSRGGFHVFTETDLPSIVRGGHNVMQVRVDTEEIFEVNIGYDSILLNSQNFRSLDDIVNKFIIVLNAAFNKDRFSPKFQTITYQANANITKGNIKDYFDKLVTFQLILPSEIKSRAVVFIFDGPTEKSNIQMILGNSQNVPDGLYLSAQVSFPDETDKYDKLFTISKEFIKNTVFPAFEIQINENTGEE